MIPSENFKPISMTSNEDRLEALKACSSTDQGDIYSELALGFLFFAAIVLIDVDTQHNISL